MSNDSSRLADVAEIRTGKLDSNEAFPNGQYPFFTCSPETLRIDKAAFDCEAVLLAGNNANAVFPVKYYKGAFNAYQRTYVITPRDSTKLDTRYLFYAIANMVAELGRHSIGTATKYLTRQILDLWPVATPPFTTQRGIARTLGALDDKIELNRRMNRALEDLASAFFRSWFIDFDPVVAKAAGRKPAHLRPEIAALFPDKFQDSEMGPIPIGWSARPVTELIQFNPPRNLAKGAVAPYLDMQNMPTDSALPQTWIMRPHGSGMRFRNGDTLVARITPCLENGKTAFVNFLAEGEVGWGSTEYLVLTPRPPLPPEYGYFLARTDDFRAYAIANMTGSSGRQRVGAGCFTHFQAVEPPDKVAHAFDDIVKPFMATMKSNVEESRTLAALRDTLLPKLLSGEIRVRDAEKLAEQSS